jgi:hypothetical protein
MPEVRISDSKKELMMSSAQMVAKHSRSDSGIVSSLTATPFGLFYPVLFSAWSKAHQGLGDVLQGLLASPVGSIYHKACHVFEAHGSHRGGGRRYCRDNKRSY